MSAPRQALQAHYRLDGKLPFEVGDKLFAKQQALVEGLDNHEKHVEKRILNNFLKDERIRPGTKEEVAR